MINNRTTYAIRALSELAQCKNNFATAEQIAKAQDIPKKFLPQILGDLTRFGFVRSIRGFGGGARLVRSPEQIKVVEIIEAVQTNIFMLDYHLDPTNGIDKNFAMVLKKVRKAMKTELGNVSLASLVAKQKRRQK